MMMWIVHHILMILMIKVDDDDVTLIVRYTNWARESTVTSAEEVSSLPTTFSPLPIASQLQTNLGIKPIVIVVVVTKNCQFQV